MDFPRRRVWWVAAGLLGSMAASVGLAQQGFTERPGDWEVAWKSDALPEPVVQHFCLTNETWAKALTQNPSCKIGNLVVTSKGIRYSVDCDMKTMRISGTTDITFDGLEHMTAKASTTTTRGGKSTDRVVTGDYRWKGAACTDADVNTKKKGAL